MIWLFRVRFSLRTSRKRGRGKGEQLTLDHIQLGRSSSTVRMQSLDEQVDVAQDDGLLLAHTPLTEPMRELPPHAAMLLAAGVDERPGLVLQRMVDFVGLFHLGLARGPVTHDVAPRPRVRKDELVGRDPHHGAVPPVHGEDVKRQVAREQAQRERDAGGAP